MKTGYQQSQYILWRAFENATGTIRTTMNTSQDYLNAVFDPSKDAIRVSMAGGMLPAVASEQDLPASAGIGQITPVVTENPTGQPTVEFYRYGGSGWTKLGCGASQKMTEEEQDALSWLAAHASELKSLLEVQYAVRHEDIELVPGASSIIVQGRDQRIVDDEDGDADPSTEYAIKISGYVLGVETYPNAESPVADRYYTRVVYEPSGTCSGISTVYMGADEYAYFAGLPDGRNVLRVSYIPSHGDAIADQVDVTLEPSASTAVVQGVEQSILDVSDSDGDGSTVYRIDVEGYVLGAECHATAAGGVTERCLLKTVYDPSSGSTGSTRIYLEQDEYDQIASMAPGRNFLRLYVMPEISADMLKVGEMQYAVPVHGAVPMALAGDGSYVPIEDSGDKDADPATMYRFSVPGYALSVQAYYSQDDTVKKNVYVKMSYDREVNATDLYLDAESYGTLESLVNGKNIISVFTLAGPGAEISRVTAIDSVLDGLSAHAVENRVLKAELDSLKARIAALEEKA